MTKTPKVQRVEHVDERHKLLIPLIKQAIESIGLPLLSTSKVVAFLKTETELSRCPSESKIRNILRSQFQLRFRATNAANIHYNDTEFDAKRVWVSRLLAQFMMAEVLVVSIDESSFK